MRSFRKVVALFLSALMVLSGLSGVIDYKDIGGNVAAYELSDVNSKAEGEAEEFDNYDEFINRLYLVTLGREADEDGLAYWSNLLRSKEITGVAAAYNFIMSSEFQSQSHSNSEYVELMYQAFFGREALTEEVSYWSSNMSNGLGRESVFENFANSEEFFNICESYDIVGGSYVSGKEVWLTSKVNLFVDGFYATILGRHADRLGLQYWTKALQNGEATGSQVAHDFVFSDEYFEANKNDHDFLVDLYRSFMGREADEAGLNYWCGLIASGKTDLEIFNSFIMSGEFTSICEGYSINRGNMVTTGRVYARAGKVPTSTPVPTNTVAPTSTNTPVPTNTAVPTSTPTPTEIPVPTYRVGSRVYMKITDDDGDGVTDTCHVYGSGATYNYNSSTIESPFLQHLNEFDSVIFEEGVTAINNSFLAGVSSVRSVTLPSTVTSIDSYAFRGTAISSVTISSSVTSIGMYAFADCANLSDVTISEEGNEIYISNYAFSNCTSLQTFTFPARTSYLYNGVFSGCTSLTELKILAPVYVSKNTFDSWEQLTSVTCSCYTSYYVKKYVDESIITVIHDGSSNSCSICFPPIPTGVDATSYSYEIIPFYMNYNAYVLVRTDNPDPSSFRIMDNSSVYSTAAVTLAPVDMRFADVTYEDYDTGRFDGGYIYSASDSDGGSLVICQYSQIAPYSSEKYSYVETPFVIECQALVNYYDLIIELCVDPEADLWTNLSSIQSFLGDNAIYPISVLDETAATKYPYLSLIPPSYSDQSVMVYASSYGYSDNQSLALYTYPFKLDSVSFPGTMSAMARRLEPSCTVTAGYNHAFRSITFNGETHGYGGQGSHGDYGYTSAQTIATLFERHLTTRITSVNQFTPTEQYQLLYGYWNAAIEENLDQYDEFDQEHMSVRIGASGSWVRIRGGYYIYSSNIERWGSENTWVDGRWCNSRGLYETGATFDDHPTAQILVTNVTYTNYRGATLTGDVIYTYDATHDAWYSARAYGGTVPNNYSWAGGKTFDEIAANSPNLVLTREQVEAMDVDRNTNVAIEHGLAYDGTVYPGTEF